jgi:REP element-mobilizing transposase RayT
VVARFARGDPERVASRAGASVVPGARRWGAAGYRMGLSGVRVCSVSSTWGPQPGVERPIKPWRPAPVREPTWIDSVRALCGGRDRQVRELLRAQCAPPALVCGYEKISAVNMLDDARADDNKRCMARARKRHVQQEIRWPNKAGDLRGRPRERNPAGKARRGRPPKPRPGVPHATRPELPANAALHVTLRVVEQVARARLRTRHAYAAIREAAITVLKHEAFRIVQLSIQGTHVHLLVETDGREALSRGMQAFEISAAKHINAALSRAGSWWERRTARGRGAGRRRKGRVFADRYHEQRITNPAQARNALAYVLNNWRKHRVDRAEGARTWLIDPYATRWAFDGWLERAGEPFLWKLRDEYRPIPVWRPRSWLLRSGWRRYGLISVREVPRSGLAEPA